jgi:ribosomal protein L11 methyltransferase
MMAFVLTVPVDDVDLASDALWQLGVRAIEERTPSDGPGDHIELWTAVGDESASLDRAVERIGNRWPWRSVEVVDADADTWREYAAPVRIDDGFVVVPAWQEHALDGDAVAISIEPGGAFGLGDHPTTVLALRALRRCLTPGADVLDVGCGTGVIAVAAAVLGAGVVRAVDIAAAAVEATIDNARRNEVADQVTVDATPATELDGSFDLVIANILAPVLVDVSEDLKRLTRVGGRLVVSGILAERHQHVLAALEPMAVVSTDILDGWAAVTLRHP